MTVTIWHNPRCSKSRQALKLLNERGISPETVLYLDTPPNEEELSAVLAGLNIEAKKLMRKGEAIYKERSLADITDNEELIREMIEHPTLIERPVVIGPKGVVIGRPPEEVLKVI